MIFALGFFMLAAGIVAPAIAWFAAGPGSVCTQAKSALKFHGVIALCGLGLAAAFFVAAIFEAPNPTMSKPPVYMEAVLGASAIRVGPRYSASGTWARHLWVVCCARYTSTIVCPPYR